MMSIPLSFPVFYYCAVRFNTNLTQYDTVSVLLLGKRRKELEKLQTTDDYYEYSQAYDISAADVTNYTSGKKQIKREILNKVMDITPQEAARRLHKLGFQDVEKITHALKRLLDISELSPQQRCELLKTDPREELSLAANIFLNSLKCPSKRVRTLSPDEQRAITYCYTNEPIYTSEPASDSSEEDKARRRIQAEIESILEGMGNSSEDNSSEDDKPRCLTQEEIEALLGGMVNSSEENKSSTLTQAEIKRIHELLQREPDRIKMKNSIVSTDLYMSEWDADAIRELINIILSSGITDLGNFIDSYTKVSAELPSFFYTNNVEALIRNVSKEDGVRIIYKFHSDDFAQEDLSQSIRVCGYIMVCTNRSFLKNYSEQQMKKYSVECFSYNEAIDYEASVYSEIGNIFCGACATTLADYLGGRVWINETDSLHKEEVDLRKGPLFVGVLPFSLPDVRSIAYLILEYESAQILFSAHTNFFLD